MCSFFIGYQIMDEREFEKELKNIQNNIIIRINDEAG